MSSPIHFYMTFNPYLNDYSNGKTQAHEFHSFLEGLIKGNPNTTAWWGKIIAQDRDPTIDLNKLQSVLNKNNENGVSTHLYICDYNFLWVGKVASISSEGGKSRNALPFYEGKKVEVWFELSDFALLTYTPEDTAHKLAELYIDNDLHDLQIHGLSPFTTAVRYPAFVQDLAEEQYFDEIENNDKLILHPNPGLYSDSAKRVLDGIHAYIFPEAMYNKIPHAAKTEIESAELDIVEKRFHNIRRNALSYIKALEIVLNDLTIGHLKRKGFGNEFYVKPDSMPPKLYLENGPGCVPINKWHKNYSITQLIYFVERCVEKNNFCFKKSFNDHRPFIQFLTKDMIPVLKNNFLLEIRGVLAHNDSNSITEKDAHVIRNIIMGLGQQGLIFNALQSFYHLQFKWMSQVQGDFSKVDFKKLLA